MMGMVTDLDKFLLFNIAGSYLYGAGQVPAALSFIGLLCAKWLIYFVPAHLLWLNFKYWTQKPVVYQPSCYLRSFFSPLCIKILLSVSLGLLASFVIGLLYYKSRPFITYPDIALMWHSSSPSFPSDHALIWGAYVYMLCKARPAVSLGTVFFAVIFAALTCWGRVFVGIHYPLDIIGGLCLGCICAWLVNKFFAIICYQMNRF